MWSNSNVRRVALARLISRTGGEAAFFVGIWGRAAFDFNASPSELAGMMAVLGVMSLAGSAVAGVLVDRFGPRRVLLLSEVLFAPAALAMIVPETMGGLTIAVAALGFVSSIVFTAVASFPPYLTDDEALLGKVNGAMEVAATSAFIAGPAIGAVLARYAGLDWIFIFDAVTSVVAVLLILPVRVRTVPHKERTGALHELREGFRFAYGLRRLRFLLLLGTVTWLSFGAFGALEPIFYREVLHTGPEALGIVNAFFGIGLASGSVLMSRYSQRLTNVRIAALLTVAGGLGAIAYSGTPYLVVVTLGGMTWGVVLGMLLPVNRTLVQMVTPDHLHGRAMGVWHTHNTLGEMVPLLVMPGIAAAFGVQQALVGTGAVVVLTGLVCLPVALRMERATPQRGASTAEALAAVTEASPKHPADQAVASDPS